MKQRKVLYYQSCNETNKSTSISCGETNTIIWALGRQGTTARPRWINAAHLYRLDLYYHTEAVAHLYCRYLYSHTEAVAHLYCRNLYDHTEAVAHLYCCNLYDHTEAVAHLYCRNLYGHTEAVAHLYCRNLYYQADAVVRNRFLMRWLTSYVHLVK